MIKSLLKPASHVDAFIETHTWDGGLRLKNYNMQDDMILAIFSASNSGYNSEFKYWYNRTNENLRLISFYDSLHGMRWKAIKNQEFWATHTGALWLSSCVFQFINVWLFSKRMFKTEIEEKDTNTRPLY